MYRIVKPLLFQLPPEQAHRLALKALNLASSLGIYRTHPSPATVQVMGLEFPNRVGLAAGFDKNAKYIDALSTLRFGFLEVGTVTPRAQSGNPLPRLFRLPAASALVNAMGFNNDGLDVVLRNLQASQYRGVLGISIGKNKITSLSEAVQDYLIGLRAVYSYASYVAINISSPGTQDLRQLQSPDYLDDLLKQLKQEQARLADEQGKYVPLVVKLAPDFTDTDLQATCQQLVKHRIDGVIATNTTISRKGVESYAEASRPGGLSGAPLTEMALQVLRQIITHLDGAMPVIASGGIMSADDAEARIQAGAALVQIYTGMVYHGPGLIKQVIARLNH